MKYVWGDRKNKRPCRWCGYAACGVAAVLLLAATIMITYLSEKKDEYLYLRDLNPTTISVTNSILEDPADRICRLLRERTGSDWKWSNNPDESKGLVSKNKSLSFSFVENRPFSNPDWYRIEVADDVRILSYSDAGFLKAISHFNTLLDDWGDDTRVLKRTYTPRGPFQYDNKSLEKYAVDEKTPEVTIRGKVYMPDGSPARLVDVDVSSYAITKTANAGRHVGYNYGAYGRGQGSAKPKTDEEGNFQFDILPGIHVMVGVYRKPVDDDLVAMPILFVPKSESNEPLTLNLRKGIPVDVTVRYPDGTPVKNRYVSWQKKFEPLIAKSDYNVRNNLHVDSGERTNENGSVTFHLSPGQYRFEAIDALPAVGRQPKYLSLNEGDRQSLELIITKPVVLRFVMPDGSRLPSLDVSVIWIGLTPFPTDTAKYRTDLTTRRTDEQGEIAVFPNPNENFVSASTPDGKSGIVRSLSQSDGGNIVLITLQPNTTIKMRLIDKSTGKAFAGKNVECRQAIKGISNKVNSFMTTHEVGFGSERLVSQKETDANGTVEFGLPSIAEFRKFISYSFRFLDDADNEKISNLRSGESLDLGSVEVD